MPRFARLPILFVLLLAGCGEEPAVDTGRPQPARQADAQPSRHADAGDRESSAFDRLPRAPKDLPPVAEYVPKGMEDVPRDDLGLPLVLEIEPPEAELPPAVELPKTPAPAKPPAAQR